METKRPYIRVCACRHVSAPDPPGEGCRFLPLMRGPVTIQGVRDPAGVRTSTGGPEPLAVRAERLLLPEHVVLPDLSQPGDFPSRGTGPEPLSGEQGSGPQGSGCLDVVKDIHKALV